MASAWGSSWGDAWGDSWGATAAAAAAAETKRKLGGPPPGSYEDERSYLPPGQWVRHEPATEDEAREIYEQAKREIPEGLQAGLLPMAFNRLGRATTGLPDAANVDFEMLGGNLGALNLLLVALLDARRIIAEQMAEAARIEAKRQKRLRDEDAFIQILARIV